MRIKRSVLLAFLLVLYIGPVIFIASYASPTIPTDVHMTKDFSIASDWYDESWHYRKNVTIGNDVTPGDDPLGTNFQVLVNVTYDSDMQVNFDDIRFTDNDAITDLDYWREEYTNSSFALFWVKVIDNIPAGVDVTICMYYGKSTVGTTSNGTATFLFFDDFENNNLDRWTTADSDWSTTATQYKNGLYSGYLDSGSTERVLTKTFDTALNTSFMVHLYARFQSTIGNEYVIHGFENDTTAIYALYSESDDWKTYDGVTVKSYEDSTQTSSTWFELELGFDFVGDEFYPYLNSVLKTKQDLDSANASNTVTDVKRIGSLGSAVADQDLWLDDFYIRNWVTDEPYFDSFGEEENNLPPPEWDIINIAILLFTVLYDPWAVNVLLIFCGLGMIPLSVIYLVWGGKNGMSMDKVFYGIVVFIFGWALFLGGIGG